VKALKGWHGKEWHPWGVKFWGEDKQNYPSHFSKNGLNQGKLMCEVYGRKDLWQLLMGIGIGKQWGVSCREGGRGDMVLGG
jgi:hypothetical protein